jgi:hypothetical protein
VLQAKHLMLLHSATPATKASRLWWNCIRSSYHRLSIISYADQEVRVGAVVKEMRSRLSEREKYTIAREFLSILLPTCPPSAPLAGRLGNSLHLSVKELEITHEME